MERSFSFEAKIFCLSAKDGCPNLCLEERRKRIRWVYFCEQPMFVMVGGYGGGGDSCTGEGSNRQILP